jgi:hypothetical protein
LWNKIWNKQAGRQADIQTRLVIHTLPFKGGMQKSGIANNLNKFQHDYEEISAGLPAIQRKMTTPTSGYCTRSVCKRNKPTRRRRRRRRRQRLRRRRERLFYKRYFSRRKIVIMQKSPLSGPNALWSTI